MAGFDPSKYGSKKSKIYGSSAADTRVDSGTETGFDPSRYGDSKSKLYSPGSMVITPEPVETQQKKRERQVVSPYGTFLGGFSFAGDRQKTAKELADEKAQQELSEQEYQRLLGLELDKYRTEVEKAGKKAQEEKAPYNIHAFGGYDTNRTTEAERQYAAMKADLNKAESLQYDVKGREALDKLTEEQTAALEVLASTEGVPAAAAQADYDRKVAARETLLASGLSEDELSQLVNYQRNIPKREKNAERYAKVQEMARNEGEKSPIGGTLLSVPANLLSGIGTVYTAVEKLRNPDTPADYHSPAMLPYAYASGVRGEVTKNLQYDHGDAAAFAYGVGTSMLDSAATAALAALGVPPAAASATLGGAAATDAMVAAKDRGLDDSHAIVTGVAAGVMESFFEKVSLESLIHMKLPTGTAKQKLAGMLKNAAIQGGIEGSEEMFTDLANLWWDKVINGDMADVEQRINAYMAGGMSHQEAQQKVVGETIKDIAVDFGAGALAGGLMGGGNMAVQTAVQHSNELTAERYRQFLQEAGVQLDDQQSAENPALDEAADKYGAQAEVFRSSYTEGQDVALYDSAYRIAYEYGKAGAKEEAVMQQDSLSYLSETQRKIAYIAGREAAAWQNGLGENGSKAWAKVQNADVESKGKLQAGFTVLYQAGLRRESAANVKNAAASALPQSVQTAAYEAGLSDAAASLAREKAGLDFVSSAGSESGLVDNEHSRKMAKEQAGTAALLNTLGKNLGVRIEMVDTISGGKANGVYIGGKNLIQIAADADNAFGFVAAHEVTHRMQELAPEEYRAYRDHAMSYRARESGEEGAAAYVERYRAMAEEAGVKLTQEEAMDEIAADFTRDMMENGKLFEDFAKENRSVARKLLDALKAFIAKVKSLFRSKTAQDRAAQDAYGKSMAELEQCAALWQKAYDAAGKRAIMVTSRTTKEDALHEREGRADQEAYGRGKGEGRTGGRGDDQNVRGRFSIAAGRYGEGDTAFGEKPYRTWVNGGLIVPKEGSVAYEEQKIAVDYKVPSFVVSDAVWDKNRGQGAAPAFSVRGQVYFRETMPEQNRGMLAAHEITHVMRQVNFAPYMDFVERTPEMLNMSDTVTRILLDHVAAHQGTTVETADPRRLYDEFNATIYGHIAAGKTELFTSGVGTGVFHDFAAYTNELRELHEAFKNRAQKAKTAAREGDGEGRYQIKNIDGRLMTVIDTQNDTRDFKAAEAYLKTLVNTDHPFSTILMDAQPVYVGKDLPGEYRSSEYTKSMLSKLRDVKMQAATNLDEMLLLAENGEWRENVKPKHAKDARNGWYRYDTEFAIPILNAKKAVDHYTVYGGTLLIRNDADGKSYLYDLLDVQKKKVISAASFSAETHSEVLPPKPSTDSISTSGEKVNGKFSLKAYSDVEKKQHVKDAKAFFGRTYKWAETGYITTDGARLDFSGKHEGGPGGYRTVDHRDIRDALGDDYGGDDYSGAMVQFMGEGNIRISPESGGINLSVMPTKAQMDTLSDFISKERGEVVLDLDDTNGVTLSSTEYPRGTHSSKVLNDIKAFFETGAVPQVSELGRFRYQLKNFSEQAVSTALYDALSEKATRQNQLIPVSVMPRYISEKLGIGGDIYIQRDHAYENMVSKEQAIQDGRPTQRKGENVHFHDLGVEKMTRAIMSINEPTMTISTKTKDGNPAVIMMLPEYGNNNAPLYAVLSFYSRKTISPENRETRPHVVLTIAERNFFEDGGRVGWAELIRNAVKEGRVLDFNKKERSSLSEVAQSAGLGDITDASLKKNLAQFQKEVKQFRESNNIRYQLKSATELEREVKELTKYAAYRQRGTTDREILLSAAEGSAKTEWERKRLAEYRDAVGRLEGYEARLSANRAELTGLSLADGKKNAKRISYLKDEITKDTNRVAIVENKLKDLEGNRSLQELLGRERAMLQQQERTYLGKVEELLGGYRGLYGTMRKGEKAARDIQLPKKSGEDEKISQTVRTVLEAKATPEEMVPDIETLALEGKYSYEVYSDKAAIADADGEIKRVGWAQALTDWKSAMKAGNVSKKNTAMGWALYNNAANSGDTETALDVLSDMVQHQRSAAQALQATRILKQVSPETQLYQAQRSIANLQTQLNEEYGDDKAPKLKIDQTLAEQFMKAADQAERDAVLANIYRDIGKQMPSRFKDKWNAWRYLAMLGNVRTHVRNVVGNAGFVPVVAAKNVVATGIEKAVYRLSGGKMERSKEFVTGKGGKALLQAAAQDYAKVADVAMGGGKYSDFANANKYIEEGRVIFQSKKPVLKQVAKPLEAARKANSRALDKEDAWFSKPHYAYAMAQYCKANGITAEMIAKGGDKVVKAREYAIKEAQKATYRDTNAFSQAISELGRMGRNSKNGAKRTIATVMEGILPFRKTPANILARGVEYSPIGLLNGFKQAIFDVQKGTKTAAEAIDAISAGLTGTGLLALGLFWAAQGLVRGHGDDDDKKNDFMELAGHQAYALELPNGTSVTLDWLAPECLPFFVGVNLWELTDGGDKPATMADWLTAISQVSEPMLEMSCLQSLNDVFDSVGYASSNGLPGLPTALVNAATSYVSQGIPTILGQAERTGEGLRYTTFTSKNSKLTNNVQYALGRASAKIPIWDYSQIPYIDAWGRTESTGDVGTRAFNNFLNPAYTSTVDMSDMEQELLRLYEVTGENVFPSRAKKYFNADNQEINLTGEQYVTYAQKKGGEAYKWLTELTQSAAYRNMSNEEKVECIDYIYKAANEVAKAEVVSSYEPTKWVKEAMSGAGVANTAIAKTAMSGMTGEDYNGDGKSDAYSKIDKQLAYINGLNLTAAQKRAMAIAFDIKEKTIDTRAPW